MTAPKPRRSMTDLERRRALALGLCSFSVGSWQKRFARELRAQANMQDPQITEKQADTLTRLCWSWRRQLPANLVPDPASVGVRPSKRVRSTMKLFRLAFEDHKREQGLPGAQLLLPLLGKVEP